MSASTLFISDLHLSASRPEVTDLFLAFLERHHPSNHTRIDALYMLGDLFDAWIGDDTSNSHDQHVMERLSQYTEQGIPLYIMPGNRDFLIGKSFVEKTQCTLLPDPTVIDLYGKRVLLMHGDLLCTLDTQYQWFRKIARSPITRFLFLSLPLSLRQTLVRFIRTQSSSQKGKQHIQPAIYDATEAAIHTQLRKHQSHLLIHGHTHKPGLHELMLDGQPAQRIVLGDWGNTGSVLKVNAQTFQMDLEIFKNA